MTLDRIVRHIKKVREYDISGAIPIAWASVTYPQKSEDQQAGRIGVRSNRLTRHISILTTISDRQ